MSSQYFLFLLSTFFRKSKCEIEVRASKGRKIRYLKMPKAVDFMFPEVVSYFTETQRNSILEQLKSTCN